MTKLPFDKALEAIVQQGSGIQQTSSSQFIYYKEQIQAEIEGRIASRNAIAVSSGQEFQTTISTRATVGIKSVGKGLEKGIPALARLAFPTLLTAELGLGVAVLAGGTSVTGGTLLAVGAPVVVLGIVLFAENRYKNRVRAKAKGDRLFFFRDAKTSELISQLITLAITTELQETLSQSKKDNLFLVSKKRIRNSLKVLNGTKVKRTKEEQRIKTFAKEEFQKIWEIFKRFARDPKEYSKFEESALSKKIRELFQKTCDLGDAADETKYKNDLELNLFWLNIFACYLEGKSEEVKTSVITTLESNLDTALATQQATIATQQAIVTEEADKIAALQERVENLERTQVAEQTTLSRSSSATSIDSFHSAYSAAFFQPKREKTEKQNTINRGFILGA